MRALGILGAGSWGTALAIALSSRFESVRLWAHHAERAAEIETLRENRRYLPGFILPPNIRVTPQSFEAVKDCDIILTAVPSHHLRSVLAPLRGQVPSGTRFVSASKGIETATFLRMSEVIEDTLFPRMPLAVLSGPTFAREVAGGEPAALVIASKRLEAAAEIQLAFATPTLRFYASDDVVGVEVGAALKNVIAIGAGICSGLGLGSNSVAALVTRGLAEITRLSVALGGRPQTLSGLAGLGDLVLTATGDLSRNRQVGIRLGKGDSLPQILAEMTMVAEGVETCQAVCQLGQITGVNLPIIRQMHDVLYRSKDPREAIRELMERPLTTE